jgi:hypothetical protein
MVPKSVIVPPSRPVPAVMDVTVPVPPPPVEEIVVIPADVVRAMPGPAFKTAATSLVIVGTPDVRSTPWPATYGKYGPWMYGLSGNEKVVFGMGMFGF